MNKEEIEKENIYKYAKRFIENLEIRKSQCKRELDVIEKMEKELIMILSNPELAKEILKGDSNETR